MTSSKRVKAQVPQSDLVSPDGRAVTDIPPAMLLVFLGEVLVHLHDGVLLLPAPLEEHHQQEVGREHDHRAHEADEHLVTMTKTQQHNYKQTNQMVSI